MTRAKFCRPPILQRRTPWSWPTPGRRSGPCERWKRSISATPTPNWRLRPGMWGLALPKVKTVAWHHQAKPETEPPPTVPGLVYQARCMERATVIEIILKPARKGIVLTSQHCWQGRQRDAGGLNDGLLLHNNSFPSGDGLKNVFQYCVVYAENCFKLFGARSCRAGQRHQILDWRHRFSPAGIVCADGPLAFNPEVPQEPRAMPFKRLVWVGSSSSV